MDFRSVLYPDDSVGSVNVSAGSANVAGSASIAAVRALLSMKVLTSAHEWRRTGRMRRDTKIRCGMVRAALGDDCKTRAPNGVSKALVDSGSCTETVTVLLAATAS